MTVLLNTQTRRDAMLAHVRDALQIDDDLLTSRLEALMDTACELVNQYAPGAPEAVAREALIRVAGWALESSAGNEETTHAGALRRSGAASLLSPWKVRRAGAIKVST